MKMIAMFTYLATHLPPLQEQHAFIHGVFVQYLYAGFPLTQTAPAHPFAVIAGALGESGRTLQSGAINEKVMLLNA